MRSNILAFFFTVGSIAMAVLIIWFYNMSDRVAPDMRFVAMELEYGPNTMESDLLNGVMAYDSKDGDITNRIVVEKTILNEEQNTAVVYYAVSDLSGNVTKQSRVFPADIEAIKRGESSLTEESTLFPENFVTNPLYGEEVQVEGADEGEASAAEGEGESAEGTSTEGASAEGTGN